MACGIASDAVVRTLGSGISANKSDFSVFGFKLPSPCSLRHAVASIAVR
jgi:hypothetical protein